MRERPSLHIVMKNELAIHVIRSADLAARNCYGR
jgi:hypothetical protein